MNQSSDHVRHGSRVELEKALTVFRSHPATRFLAEEYILCLESCGTPSQCVYIIMEAVRLATACTVFSTAQKGIVDDDSVWPALCEDVVQFCDQEFKNDLRPAQSRVKAWATALKSVSVWAHKADDFNTLKRLQDLLNQSCRSKSGLLLAVHHALKIFQDFVEYLKVSPEANVGLPERVQFLITRLHTRLETLDHRTTYAPAITCWLHSFLPHHTTIRVAVAMQVSYCWNTTVYQDQILGVLEQTRCLDAWLVANIILKHEASQSSCCAKKAASSTKSQRFGPVVCGNIRRCRRSI
ncbi:MAG: hypothetical protein KVP17_004137 [Porospora cf. gigantea B]|nr:MAG: hypothetical protein KVP17_004137 [Porospora cf. gigantea B]